MKTSPMIPFVALLAGFAGFASAPFALCADEAVVLKALKDEMARSIDRLQMENVERPFYVSYVLDESDVFSCSSAFGALQGAGRNPSRSCSIDVRVGSFDLDNTNFARGGGGAAGVSLPEDDDYGAIRQNLWLVTDRRYKDAVEELAAKKAWLQTNVVTDRPADWTVVPPVEHLEPKRTLTVDEAKMKELTRALSARFTGAAKIQSSSVSLRAAAENRTLLSTEGFHTRTGETWFRLSVTAGTQADDGMPIGDVRVFYGRTAADFPPEAELVAAVDAMIEKLTARTSAPRAEEYIGPVLFEGDAACQVLSELLVQRLSDAHEPLGSRDAGSPFKNRLKKRIAPPFLTVVDDPSQRSFEGTPLLGAFEVDHDGVKTRPVTLVEEGRLKEWYMSRIPTRAIKETNGHSRGGSGGAGCVFARSTNGKSRDELRKELVRIAVEQELPYAIRVESLARPDVTSWGPRASGWYSDGQVDLSAPVAAYRVYPDGHEEPIRGAQWQGVTLRTLRDIFLTSDRMNVMNTVGGGAFVSIVCPDLLVEELEIKKPAPQEAKLPYLAHPSFAKE